MLYQITQASKAYGAQEIFSNVTFEIKDKEKVAIVGRNGCGKTTLLRAICEEEPLDRGEIHKEKGMRIGYLAQTTFAREELSVLEDYEGLFTEIHAAQKRLDELGEKMTLDPSDANLADYAKMQEKLEALGAYTYKQEMLTLFTKFGFKEEELYLPIDTFSGGQKTRLAFVKLLLSKPDILLLDEPTNHLDLGTIEWLEGYVKHYPKAIVMVSHDRTFLDHTTDVIYELSNGSLTKYVGNYTHYVETKRKDIEKQKSAYARQQKEIKQLEGQIEKFRYKANKAKFAQSKLKYLDRMERVEVDKADDESFHATFQSRIKGGSRVLDVEDLLIGYDQPLAKVSFKLMRNDRCAIMGDNGIGKSTLMKTLIGKIGALGGEFMLGHQIEMGYFDQEIAQFHSEKTVLEELWNEAPDYDQTQIRTILGRFLFSGDEVFKNVNVLSGGEKVRLTLAKLMLKQANFLLLDEPTNHLDIPGKEALEESLKDYDGTLLFVSHDRYFIDKMATSLLVFETGRVQYYPLTYAEYMEKRMTMQAVKETKAKEVKKTKARSINYAKEVKKLETEITELEKSIKELNEKTFLAEYYESPAKMKEIEDALNQAEKDIEEKMLLWEEYSEKC